MRISLTLALALMAHTPSFALNGVSRACAFGDIPSTLQGPAQLLLNIIGTAPMGKFDGLIHLSQTEKNKHWILESLTTDWGRVRYYLYAENRVYRYMRRSYPGVNTWDEWTSYRSAGWTAQSVPDEVYTDSRFQMFFANRGILTSARAGDPEIIAYYPPKTADKDQFWVVGNHYYYDSVNKFQAYLGKTEATNCNLTQWGFGDR